MIRETLEALFDYSVVPDAIATEMREAAGRIRRCAKTAFFETGMALLKIKGRIDHGHFLAWIEPECQLKIRTAQRAMQVAELVIKNVNLTYLPIDGLLLLASRSAPKPLRDEIIQRIEAGDRPTAAEIKREFERARATTKIQREAHQRQEQKPDPGAGQQLSYSRVELRRVADMLVEKLGDRINEVVRVLETATTAELAKALRERRPDLFDPDDQVSAERGSSVEVPEKEAGLCAPPAGAGSTEPLSPEVADAPVNSSPPSPDPAPPASDSSFEGAHEPPGIQQQTRAPKPINHPLEDAYQAMSVEERDRDRHFVMSGHARGEAPAERSPFLAQYLTATLAEQKAFRSRRVAEPTRKAA